MALVACLSASCSGGRADAPDFTVAAASSLTDVVERALVEFEAETGRRGRASFGSSSTLARQVEHGAPFQVFLSADARWLAALDEAELLVAGSAVELARNGLVIASREGVELPLDLDAPLDVTLRPHPWTTGDPDHVPLGGYARAVLESLGWWRHLEPTLVPTGDARSALRLVERGEVHWGLVYASDVGAATGLEVLQPVDPSLHPPIAIHGACVDGSDAEARRFLDWLAGPGGRALFEAGGFGPSGGSE